MTGTRKKTSLADRRRQVAEMYLRGEYQSEIAKHFGVNQSTISRDIAALRDEWLQSALVDINEAKAKELAKVDQLEREYWDAWQRSREEYTSTIVKGKGDQQTAKNIEKTVKTEERHGDPRYLAGVQWCINKRCEILGLDAPKRQEHTGADGGPIETKDANSEERTRALSSLADALGDILSGAGE